MSRFFMSEIMCGVNDMMVVRHSSTCAIVNDEIKSVEGS